HEGGVHVRSIGMELVTGAVAVRGNDRGVAFPALAARRGAQGDSRLLRDRVRLARGLDGTGEERRRLHRLRTASRVATRAGEIEEALDPRVLRGAMDRDDVLEVVEHERCRLAQVRVHATR